VNTGVVQELRAAALAASGRVPQAPAPAVRRVAPAVPEQALPAWCSLRWALEPLYRPTTHSSTSMVARSIKTSPRVANFQIYGVPSLQLNTGQISAFFTQAFPTGTSISLSFNDSRQTTNSPYFNLSPTLSSTFRFQFSAGIARGFSGSVRTCAICELAQNNKKIFRYRFKGPG